MSSSFLVTADLAASRMLSMADVGLNRDTSGGVAVKGAARRTNMENAAAGEQWRARARGIGKNQGEVAAIFGELTSRRITADSARILHGI